MVFKSRLPQLIGHLSQTTPSPALKILFIHTSGAQDVQMMDIAL